MPGGRRSLPYFCRRIASRVPGRRRWWNAEAFEVRIDEASEDDRGEMDAKTREQLEALGYLN